MKPEEHKEEKTEERPLSESNIEYIKTKINRSKKQQSVQWGGLYRLLIFLLALVGFGGILYMFWDIFDFFAVATGAFGMMVFIRIMFKVARLWDKTMFVSVYFLTFLVLACGGIFATLFGDQYTEVDQVRAEISTFIEGIKGVESQDLNLETTWNIADIGFLFEETGEVLGISLSGDSQFSGVVMSWESLKQGEASKTTTGEVKVADTEPAKDPSKQVTMIEAIKYLIKDNAIPLSSSKNVKFTYVAMSNEDYPYMKTALEKRMIGATTDPNMLISCDVYMVMKGLARGRSSTNSVDVKTAYWNVAETKQALNGCKKGAKLTVWNL